MPNVTGLLNHKPLRLISAELRFRVKMTCDDKEMFFFLPHLMVAAYFPLNYHYIFHHKTVLCDISAVSRFQCVTACKWVMWGADSKEGVCREVATNASRTNFPINNSPVRIKQDPKWPEIHVHWHNHSQIRYCGSSSTLSHLNLKRKLCLHWHENS